ncbi:hypothetical protein K402DRAFT_400880 [Aulographum hederae CBS 113979]|uniref:Secretory phospholipase A2 n=1 Tax=Aulographum hederae CBS 113979 TaxID=1176131 RepID=A0A6G1HCB0_9PEZI|nr:hypothetical protein K402DRAFT_400880 [Aulographum hederae CBS 113979]
MKFSLAVFALFSVASALPNMERRQCSTALTDDYIFAYTLPAFEAKRNALDPSCFDWSSDNCSDSPDNPFGFPFEPACQRHDFGYRNYKIQGRFTEANCQAINSNFKTDLDDICTAYSGAEGTGCRALASTYYAAVKEFGCD